MAGTIDNYSNGINALEKNLKALDPGHEAGYVKFADTQRELVRGHNEVWAPGGLSDQVKDLREALKGIPFVPSSTG